MIRASAVRRRARLQVAVTDGSGRSHPLAPALGRWLRQHAPQRARGTVAVALVSDARMRALNRAFRGVDRPTDVLSFPESGVEPSVVHRRVARRRPDLPQASSLKPQASAHLGDLAIALGVAGRQARAQGHDLATELRILALHGLLHLMGYDHERDRGTMRTLEERLRRRAGLPAGLLTRTPARDRH